MGHQVFLASGVFSEDWAQEPSAWCQNMRPKAHVHCGASRHLGPRKFIREKREYAPNPGSSSSLSAAEVCSADPMALSRTVWASLASEHHIHRYTHSLFQGGFHAAAETMSPTALRNPLSCSLGSLQRPCAQPFTPSEPAGL